MPATAGGGTTMATTGGDVDTSQTGIRKGARTAKDIGSVLGPLAEGITRGLKKEDTTGQDLASILSRSDIIGGVPNAITFMAVLAVLGGVAYVATRQ